MDSIEKNRIERFIEFLEIRYSIHQITMLDVFAIIESEKDSQMDAETLHSVIEFKSSLNSGSILSQLIDVIINDKFYETKINSGHFAPLMLFIDCYNELNENDMHFYKAMYITYSNAIQDRKQLPEIEGFKSLLEFCSGEMNYN